MQDLQMSFVCNTAQPDRTVAPQMSVQVCMYSIATVFILGTSYQEPKFLSKETFFSIFFFFFQKIR